MKKEGVKTIDDYKYFLFMMILRNIVKILKVKIKKLEAANAEIEKKLSEPIDIETFSNEDKIKYAINLNN